MLNERRMERCESSFSGPDVGQDALHPSIALFRAIAKSNHLRPRRRFLRARCLASPDDHVEVWGDDVRPAEPSGDESVPAESQDVPLNRLSIRRGYSPYGPVGET